MLIETVHLPITGICLKKNGTNKPYKSTNYLYNMWYSIQFNIRSYNFVSWA